MIKNNLFQQEMSGAIDESGKQIGFKMTGMINCITIVTFHHVWLVMMQNNFDAICIAMTIWSYA